jgi:hypothetical protein
MKVTIHRAKNIYSCSFLLSVHRQPNVLSKWSTVDVDSARVNAVNFTDVSDIPATSIFPAQVSGHVIYVYYLKFTANKKGEYVFCVVKQCM